MSTSGEPLFPAANTDPTHRNHFNSYSFTCFMPDRTPLPFYTTLELKPIRTYVTLANLWRAL
ncbi:MAG: hypothetical protein H0U18_07670 [Pyrinomonadaceae bacterium]|nr:hypothetical protein [Pyrinomonadaceae bacterium]